MSSSAADRTTVQQYLHAMSPRTTWSMADGYPPVLKQFIQFCLILVYPGWIFTVLVGALLHAAFYVTVYPVWWVLFWPLRAWMRKNRPDEYAASQRKRGRTAAT